MKKLIYLILLTAIAFPQKTNKEFRATWVITWEYISSSSSVETNKARIRQILDDHKHANMTSVLWQVRQGGTAYYQSAYEPWGPYCGSTYPGFDPLAYAIDEAHKRGLELHAWFNTFSVSSAAGSPAQLHPEWICRDNAGSPMTSSIALSPGLTAVRNYTLNVAADLLRKYDIDGLHLDYIRWNEYSSSEASKAYAKKQEEAGGLDRGIPDDIAADLENNQAGRYLYDAEHPYSAGVPTGYASWDEWWRASVTSLVKSLHDTIKTIKPHVRLSCAALGKYNWSSWQGYGYVYQDAALWFNQGYIDQLTPMHYHWTTGAGFTGMLSGACPQCWSQFITQGINTKRLYSVGPGSYILDEQNVWDKHPEIVEACRTVPWTDGFQFFSYGSWQSHNYFDFAGKTFFKKITKVKAAKYMFDTTVTAPAIAIQKIDSMHYRLTVTPPSNSPNNWYVIYRSEKAVVEPDTADIVARFFGNSAFSFDEQYLGTQDFNGKYKYAAARFDRYWNESGLSNIVESDKVPSFAPKISGTVPLPNDSLESAGNVVVKFSKTMNTASANNAIHLSPSVTGISYIWSDLNHTLTITHTQAFPFGATVQLTVDSTAADINGVQLDGNGDGLPGDSYRMTFKTVSQDITPPTILNSYPDTTMITHFDIEEPINVVFSELMNQTTINNNTVILKKGNSVLTKDYRFNTTNNRTVLSLRVSGALLNNTDYTLQLTTGIKDMSGNALKQDYIVNFRTSGAAYTTKKLIDDFNTEANWWAPSASGSTIGIVDTGTAFGYSTTTFLPATSPMKSAYLQYQWNPTASTKLIREYLSGGTPQGVTFDTSYVLQVFLYGDGSGNRFRFAIDEGSSASSWLTTEVMKWLPINWTGWRLVEWQLNDPETVGTWIGNGALDNLLYRIDSFQLTDASGAPVTGKIFFDDLRAVKKSIITDIQRGDINAVPSDFELKQNFPNPFNPSTTIEFAIPRQSEGRLTVYNQLGEVVDVLFDGVLSPGLHSVTWNAGAFPSGVYFYELKTGQYIAARKLLLVK